MSLYFWCDRWYLGDWLYLRDSFHILIVSHYIFLTWLILYFWRDSIFLTWLVICTWLNLYSWRDSMYTRIHHATRSHACHDPATYIKFLMIILFPQKKTGRKKMGLTTVSSRKSRELSTPLRHIRIDVAYINCLSIRKPRRGVHGSICCSIFLIWGLLLMTSRSWYAYIFTLTHTHMEFVAPFAAASSWYRVCWRRLVVRIHIFINTRVHTTYTHTHTHGDHGSICCSIFLIWGMLLMASSCWYLADDIMSMISCWHHVLFMLCCWRHVLNMGWLRLVGSLQT